MRKLNDIEDLKTELKEFDDVLKLLAIYEGSNRTSLVERLLLDVDDHIDTLINADVDELINNGYFSLCFKCDKLDEVTDELNELEDRYFKQKKKISKLEDDNEELENANESLTINNKKLTDHIELVEGAIYRRINHVK